MSDFPIDSDFYTPEKKIIFAQQYRENIPSQVMWALLLYVHPRSEFFNLDLSTREYLLKKEYLGDDDFNFADYEEALAAVKEYVLTTAEAYLSFWDKKIRERVQYMDSIPYDKDNYDMLDKMLKDGYPMMKQFKEIKKDFDSEVNSSTVGDREESLLEKGII